MNQRNWEDANWLGRGWIVICYGIGIPFALVGLVLGWCFGAFCVGFRSGMSEANEA